MWEQRQTIHAMLSVVREREAQDAQWGRIDATADPGELLAILAEEVGEVATLVPRPPTESIGVMTPQQTRHAIGRENLALLLAEAEKQSRVLLAHRVALVDPAHMLPERTTRLREELVQVAAVALKWIESIDAANGEPK